MESSLSLLLKQHVWLSYSFLPHRPPPLKQLLLQQQLAYYSLQPETIKPSTYLAYLISSDMLCWLALLGVCWATLVIYCGFFLDTYYFAVAAFINSCVLLAWFMIGITERNFFFFCFHILRILWFEAGVLFLVLC